MQSPLLRLMRGVIATSALIGLALGLAAQPVHAQAGYYTYTLNDVSFNSYGTGTASGYFDYDPTTNTIGSFDFTTSGGLDHAGDAVVGMEFDNADVTHIDTQDSEPNYFGFLADNGMGFGFDTFEDVTGESAIDLFDVIEAPASYDPSSGVTIYLGQSPARYGFIPGTLTGTPAAAAVPELSPLAAVALMSLLGGCALAVAGLKRRGRISSVV